VEFRDIEGCDALPTIIIMNVPENFNINILEILAESYGNDFDRTKNLNVIGWSELPYGMRKLVLMKLHGVKPTFNLKMLLGEIMHGAIQKPETLSILIAKIVEQCNIDVKTLEIIPEDELMYEVLPGKHLKSEPKMIQGHIDTNATLFSIEIKTTNTYAAEWDVNDLNPNYVFQLNGYLGSKQQYWGYLIVINMRAFQNTFKSFQESAEKWTTVIPIKFNEKLFELSIEKAKTIFLALEENFIDLPCSEHEWECKYCDVREPYCGKVEITCEHVSADKNGKPRKCVSKMYDWPECLSRAFKNSPICRNCYENKTQKRIDYNEFKYIKQYPWDE